MIGSGPRRLEDEHNENDADCEIDRVIDQS